MGLYVHYDLTGKIHSFTIVNGPKGTGAMLAGKAGVLVAEAEGVQPQSGEAAIKELREIAKSHLVENPSPRCKLRKK
jgi:cobalamin biosynthesis protein CbiD